MLHATFTATLHPTPNALHHVVNPVLKKPAPLLYCKSYTNLVIPCNTTLAISYHNLPLSDPQISCARTRGPGDSWQGFRHDLKRAFGEFMQGEGGPWVEMPNTIPPCCCCTVLYWAAAVPSGNARCNETFGYCHAGGLSLSPSPTPPGFQNLRRCVNCRRMFLWLLEQETPSRSVLGFCFFLLFGHIFNMIDRTYCRIWVQLFKLKAQITDTGALCC